MRHSYRGVFTLASIIATASCIGAAPEDPGGGSTGGSMTEPDTGSGSDSDSQTVEHIYGVTITDVAPLQQIVTSLQGLPRRATARIVFDENVPASEYTQAVTAIAAVGDVMGEILDSWYVPVISTSAYLARTQQYFTAFANQVDIWEIGNEINGEWVDDNAGGAAEVVAKMAGAFDIIHGAGGKTALTLYGCSDTDARYDMITWATANVPARMKTGLDYVLVSFYEGDCGVAPPDWQTKFAELRAIFPNAKLGFGEVGAVDTNGDPITNPAIAGPYLERYYQLPITVAGYIGGHFWWYYVEDMLPLPSAMYTVLCNAIQ
jgi:hypothetical protein